MAETDRSLLAVTVGDPPNADCPTHLSFEVRLGGENTAEVVRSIEAKMQAEADPFLPYVVLESESEEAARELEGIVREAWSEQGEDGSMLSTLLSTLHQYTQLDITVLDSTVILKFSLDPILRQQVEAYFDVLYLQAREALAQETAISVEIDAGGRTDEMANSRNAIGLLCNSVRVKLEVTLWKGLAAALSNISTLMSAPASVTTALSAFGIYRNARLELNFNSLQDLPESVQALVPESGVLTALIAMGKQLIVQKDLALLRKVARTVRSAVHVCAKGKFLAACGSARLVGVGGLLESE